MVIGTIRTLTSDTDYDLFWKKVTRAAESFDFVNPLIPRKVGLCDGEFHDTPFLYYCQQILRVLTVLLLP